MGQGGEARAAAGAARGRGIGRGVARGGVTRGYLGLGSNVGDRLKHLKDAVASLPRHGVQILRSSSVYETEPVGLVPDQRDFFNACLRIET
ncbi:MAG: 2-amino-4-hydroxy-6-hydroxymethyldihydropteridine diphosphokinase, partial [Actinobacteria bacterium]